MAQDDRARHITAPGITRCPFPVPRNAMIKLARLSLLVALLSTACAPDAGAPPSGPFDVLIVGGRLLDGTGNPWVRADVAIQGDRVVAVGDLANASAERTVDATGLYVTPGFIDTHSHAAEGLSGKELSGAIPLLAQGITMVLVNPDGGGPVDLAEQREELEADGLGVNVGQFVPQGAIRREVLGMEDRAPTAEELERMRVLVRKGMEEGAFGLSTGLFYTPGGYAKTDEVVELARVAAGFDGAYQSHIRDESSYDIGLLAAVQEVVTIAEQAEMRGVVTHIKALGPDAWGMADDVIALIQAARDRGVEVFADQYPYPGGSTGLRAALVPAWAQEGGTDAMRARFDDPEVAPRLRAEMEENLVRRAGPERILFRRVETQPELEGMTLAEVAQMKGMDPLDAAVALLKETGPSIVSLSMREEDVRRFMRLPWTMTASDGGLDTDGIPHPRSYGTFPLKLQRYALEEQVVDLASAIRSMTSLPATVYRIDGRGLIKPGAMADVVVFDPATLRSEATFTDPRRLAEGVRHVWVGGVHAVDEGKITGALGGHVIRRRR